MAATSARARLGTPEERVKVLEPLLLDGHRGVRLAAALSMAQSDMVARCAATLVKHLDRERRRRTQGGDPRCARGEAPLIASVYSPSSSCSPTSD